VADLVLAAWCRYGADAADIDALAPALGSRVQTAAAAAKTRTRDLVQLVGACALLGPPPELAPEGWDRAEPAADLASWCGLYELSRVTGVRVRVVGVPGRAPDGTPRGAALAEALHDWVREGLPVPATAIRTVA
jgi:hypothetical protein